MKSSEYYAKPVQATSHTACGFVVEIHGGDWIFASAKVYGSSPESAEKKAAIIVAALNADKASK